VGPASRLLLKFGLFFFDYEPGRASGSAHAKGIGGRDQQNSESQSYAQPAQLFWTPRAKRWCFVVVPPEKCGGDLFQPLVGRGSAFADIDGDGDLDLSSLKSAEPRICLRNDQALHHHWLRLKLVGPKATGTRSAPGSKVRVNGQNALAASKPTRSYLSQSELPVTIGPGQRGPA